MVKYGAFKGKWEKMSDLGERKNEYIFLNFYLIK